MRFWEFCLDSFSFQAAIHIRPLFCKCFYRIKLQMKELLPLQWGCFDATVEKSWAGFFFSWYFSSTWGHFMLKNRKSCRSTQLCFWSKTGAWSRATLSLDKRLRRVINSLQVAEQMDGKRLPIGGEVTLEARDNAIWRAAGSNVLYT